MPQNLYTEIIKDDIIKDKRLKLIAESQKSGVGIFIARNGRDFLNHCRDKNPR